MTKTFNEITVLRRNASEFETFWDRYKSHTSKSHIDKYGACFGGDSRFSNFKVATFFESHSGEYGNSSCGRFGRFDEDLAQKYMIRAMNALREQLFAKCAELMKVDAAAMVAKAQEEVAAMQKSLEACLAEVPNVEFEE